MYTVLLVIHTMLVLFLIGIILLQRSSSDGLSGLGGGGGGNQFLTGRSSANLMTRTTAFLAAGFMITSLVLAIIANRMTSSSIVDAVPVVEESAPAAKTAPVELKQEEQKAPAKKNQSTPVVPKPE